MHAVFSGLQGWWAVLAIALICLTLAFGGDTLRVLGRYDRVAVQQGEYWRLLTGHLLHLGFGHLWPNLAALSIMGALFRDFMSSRDWLVTGGAAALAIDAGLYWLDPNVSWYVGLSGVLHGFLAAGAFALLMRREGLGALLAIGISAKLIYEQAFGPIPFTAATTGGPVIVAAHLYGAAGGLLAASIAHARRLRRSQL